MRVAAAEADPHGGGGQVVELVVVAGPERRAIGGADAAAVAGPAGGVGVPGEHRIVLFAGHQHAPVRSADSNAVVPGDGEWEAAHDQLGGGGEAVKAAVVDPPPARVADPFHMDEAGLAEDLQMVRDGRLADVEGVDDLADVHRPRLGGQQVQDQDAGRVAERLEPARPRRGVVTRNLHRPLTIVDGLGMVQPIHRRMSI